ncbi:MAG: hypothetical protein JSW58_10095, partial [Candidatus Latescibacterota bacterium]
LRGRVVLRETLGHDILTHVDLDGEEIVVRGGDRLAGGVGGQTYLKVSDGSLHFFSRRDGKRIETQRVESEVWSG